ncbi:membrane protein [Mycolicibacterium anyangense]|uniref:Membrane protein n=2 Tax=Mycolicibacterium anyangense TaxID=1431246 RepID=A0A6N4W0D6_9MYCO|nr:membrane protein [Mycolicibacterium anyangense]
MSGPPVTSEPVDEEDKKTPAQALLAQMGGISGLIYSALPVAVLVPVNTAFGLVPAISAALGVAALILVWRLIRRDSVQPAVSGFIGVGISALIAWMVGASKGYFLLGIWTSLVWAVVFALSILIRRPVVGYVWSWVNGHDRAWRTSRRAVLAFDIATLTWVLVFGARFAVQHHLYDADRTGWLGVARIAMGWPLTAVAALVTYLAIRVAQRAVHAQHAEESDGQTADAQVTPVED